MKLNVGDTIQVHGWVMLNKLNDGGKFKVAKITKQGFSNIYWFTRTRGKKMIIGHRAASIDSAIHNNGMNRIEIITQ